MIENIRDAFVELLDEAQWMDESTREFAREKVSGDRPLHASDGSPLSS